MTSEVSKEQRAVRITLDLDPEFYARLEKLRRKVGKTKAGVIRDALRLYEDVAEKSMSGSSFLVVDAKGRSRGISFFGRGNA